MKFLILLAALALAQIRAHSGDDQAYYDIGRAHIREALTRICSRAIARLPRKDALVVARSVIRAGFSEEDREEMTVMIPLLMSQIHVLKDLYEDANGTMKEFHGRCSSYADALIEFFDRTSEKFTTALPAIEKFLLYLQKLCPHIPRLNHVQVVRIVAKFTDENLSKVLLGIKGEVRIWQQLVLHLLISNYELFNHFEGSKSATFVDGCRDVSEIVVTSLTKYREKSTL